ncbi:hypothetical protein ACFL6B_05180 [Thermodesulfobacteriota bacterium]
MAHDAKPITLADPKRFKTIQDLTRLRPDCGASIDDILVITDETLLIIDMGQLGNILNPYNSSSASHVRTHGVIVHSYIRNEPCPVLRSDPYLLLPLSHHLKKDLSNYTEIGKVVGSVPCPSGSFLLLPNRKDVPPPLNNAMDVALENKTGAKIKLPNGTFRVFYEQFEAPKDSKKEFYQNIVIQRQ